MKKRSVGIACLIAVAAALAGCTSGDPHKNKGEPTLTAHQLGEPFVMEHWQKSGRAPIYPPEPPPSDPNAPSN